MNEKLFPCPCCGQFTLDEQPPGTYSICEVCDWEDDPVQFADPDCEGGANARSLNQQREWYRQHARDAQGRLRYPRQA
ncbi:CPCC family cysteine-rich protein [uncultured Paludibaculum sp.]|uniref:CPCC family cysteine-rich protein n=1 Tax=uncultured Paludibaculum sp. TaxID=1765020 RepID=UPI00374CBA36